MEPTYRFVKGQGWVVHTAPMHTFACGTVCRLEFRKPVEGEYYDHGGLPIFGTTENPNIEAWMEVMKTRTYKYKGMPKQRGRATDIGCYVVFVPVNK